MAKDVLLNAGELADLYALKTLHDYLVDRKIDANFYFRDNIESDRSEELLAGLPIKKEYQSVDLVVSALSDVSDDTYGSNNLLIDISILKNCALPLTDDEKSSLREKYGIISPQPVITIGYAADNERMERVIRELCKDSAIFLVGEIDPSDVKDIHKKAINNVHCIQEEGILKDYYAMADAAINAENLKRKGNHEYMHNFIEATEGGPLFMIRPGNTAQYGYRQLADMGVIREYAYIKDLVRELKQFIKDFKGNEEHNRKRSRHIRHARNRYLPVIESSIKTLLGIGCGGLTVTAGEEGLTLLHPETDWD